LCKYNNVRLICSDWLKPFVSNSFDIIFSNPPYISINDLLVDKSVLANEPSIALFSAEDGLKDIKKIIRHAKKTLSRLGILFLENGLDQSLAVKSILESEDFTDIRVHLDYNKCGRFTSSRNKNG
jgi:release factor glutamine methyltransferase